MATDVLDNQMAKEKSKTLSTKLHMDVIETARIVAAFRNEMITDLLSDILRPVLLQMETDEMQKRDAEKKAAKGKAKPAK